MRTQNEELAYQLLKIAKTDLKASKVLYINNIHAQSYFYFQQATEKTTKAVALLLNMSTAKDTFNMRHDVFKLHQKNIKDGKRQNELAVDLARALPFLETSGFLEINKIEKQIMASEESMRLFENLRNYDLINIPAKEINQFLENIESLEIKRAKLPSDLENKIEGLFMPFIEKMELNESKAAQYMAKELRDAIRSEEFGQFIREHFADVIKTTIHFLYAYSVLYFSGLLTIQHSSVTRYPDTNDPQKNPLFIYKKKLPIVRYQMQFLEHLEKAIKIIEIELS